MNSKKILVIDDESDVVAYLTMVLEDQGYETCSAKNGLEGMEKIRKERPDLVCLDLLMPEKTGVKLYHEMRKDPDLKNIPVVMITAWGPRLYPDIDFKRFIHHRKVIPPPEGYFEKPFDREALMQAIAGIFERQANQPL